jgi:hypothetical protein
MKPLQALLTYTKAIITFEFGTSISAATASCNGPRNQLLSDILNFQKDNPRKMKPQMESLFKQATAAAIRTNDAKCLADIASLREQFNAAVEAAKTEPQPVLQREQSFSVGRGAGGAASGRPTEAGLAAAQKQAETGIAKAGSRMSKIVQGKGIKLADRPRGSNTSSQNSNNAGRAGAGQGPG